MLYHFAFFFFVKICGKSFPPVPGLLNFYALH